MDRAQCTPDVSMRLEAFEKEVRTLRIMMTCVFIVLCIIALAALRPHQGTLTIDDENSQSEGALVEILRAKRFVLIDEDGSERAALYVSSEGPVLEFNGSAKDNRLRRLLGQNKGSHASIRLGMTEEGPALTLSDQEGVQRIAFNVRREGPSLAVIGEDGNERISLWLNDDVPNLALLDSDAKQRLVLHLQGGTDPKVIGSCPFLTFWGASGTGSRPVR